MKNCYLPQVPACGISPLIKALIGPCTTWQSRNLTAKARDSSWEKWWSSWVLASTQQGTRRVPTAPTLEWLCHGFLLTIPFWFLWLLYLSGCFFTYVCSYMYISEKHESLLQPRRNWLSKSTPEILPFCERMPAIEEHQAPDRTTPSRHASASGGFMRSNEWEKVGNKPPKLVGGWTNPSEKY